MAISTVALNVALASDISAARTTIKEGKFAGLRSCVISATVMFRAFGMGGSSKQVRELLLGAEDGARVTAKTDDEAAKVINAGKSLALIWSRDGVPAGVIAANSPEAAIDASIAWLQLQDVTIRSRQTLMAWITGKNPAKVAKEPPAIAQQVCATILRRMELTPLSILDAAALGAGIVALFAGNKTMGESAAKAFADAADAKLTEMTEGARLLNIALEEAKLLAAQLEAGKLALANAA